MDANTRAHTRAEDDLKAKGGDSESIHMLGSEYAEEYWILEDKHRYVTTRYLVKRANRLQVPVPERTENGEWIESQYHPGRYHLAPDALHKLRSDVRSEFRARLDWWIVGVSLAIGLLGAATAFVSAFKAAT